MAISSTMFSSLRTGALSANASTLVKSTGPCCLDAASTAAFNSSSPSSSFRMLSMLSLSLA